MRTRIYWLALATLVGTATAQAASIDGPRMGTVFDPAVKGLRPILGAPGAAVLGDPLGVGIELTRAAVSPLQDYVITTTGEAQAVVLLNLGRSPIAVIPVPGADAAPDQIVLSPNGRAVALYYKDRNRIQILTGLPAAPKVSTELMLSAGLSPSALAVGDDGSTVLAGIGHVVFLVTAHGEVPILNDLGQVAAMTVWQAAAGTVLPVRPVRDLQRDTGVAAPAVAVRQTALVVDGAQNKIYRVNDVTGNASTDILAGPGQGISTPVGVAVSSDGHLAFVANAKSGAIAILTLQGEGTVENISCKCALTGLDRLAGDRVFRLTEPSNQPMWVLDAGAHTPRVVFVPANLARSGQK